jgi:hypothetical protein
MPGSIRHGFPTPLKIPYATIPGHPLLRASKAQALILNEYAIEAGSTRGEAFDRITNLPTFLDMAKSSVRVWMPRLFPAEAIEARECRFLDARDAKVTPPLGLFDAARLKAWLEAMNRRFAGVASWIP